MSPDKLAYMANQIARFFASRPEAEAVAGVAEHINQFWEPRMRRQLLEMLRDDSSELSDIVRKAESSIRRPS